MRGGSILGREAFAEADVAEAGEFDERAPDGVDEAVFDEESPEAIGAFVEKRHREVWRDGGGLVWATGPD